MNKKPSVHLFTIMLAAWLLTFAVVSVGFCETESVCEKASIITKLHASNVSNLASEPCEEKEARDSSSEIQVVFTSITLQPILCADDLSFGLFYRLYCSASFCSTTNLPLYLAKKSFLI